ncbi:hypothetical protein ACFX2A_025395 [Malus domestica]
MAHAYNHASAEARTYQGKPPTTNPYQQVGSGSQIQPNEKTSTFQTAAVPPLALLNTFPSPRCLPLPYLILFQVNRHINLRVKGKISILTSLILVKGVRDTAVITKGIAMIIPDPKQSTQWVKHVLGQPRP